MSNITNANVRRREKRRGGHTIDYVPVIVVVVMTGLAALAKQGFYMQWDARTMMTDFMGFFLVVFSLFKFFDLQGFADGFQMYDLVAKRFRSYAYIYPFIEAGLGLCYLAQWQLMAVSLITIVLLIVGMLGVLFALQKGLDLECACMGSILHVPLSTVALVEDVGMAAMALAMLVATIANV